MTDEFSLDPFVTDELYPGYRPGFMHGAFNVDAIQPFQATDADRFWLKEGHWPRGIVPLGYSCIEECAWGTQWAAQALPVPTGKGLSARMAGTHVYNSEIAVTSEWEITRRSAMAAESFPARIGNFPAEWERCVALLLEGSRHLEQADLDEVDLSGVAQYFAEACDFQRWAWEQHFIFMYPLLANYFGLRGLCEELGIDTDLVARFLQGFDTKILATDRKLWELAEQARTDGLAALFADNEVDGGTLLQALTQAEAASAWLDQFHGFLDEYGWRTEGMADPDLAPWVEDPSPPLRMIRTFIVGEGHDFKGTETQVILDREAAIETARSSLTSSEQEAFDAAVAACHHANFAWWNEEHDFYIDLRVHIPLRRAALALGRVVGADRPDDCVYLFRSEFEDVANGRRLYSDFRPVIPVRRAHRESWAARRTELPSMLGSIPDNVNDPVMKEIFGIDKRFLELMRSDNRSSDELRGVAASGGTYTGVARVLTHAGQIGSLKAGDVLVCEFTSPNWTPAFALIGACVADQGGALAHTAIVSREYRVPAVTGVGIGTASIRDGDIVAVDGTAGIVRILERADAVTSPGVSAAVHA
ncbi:MAG: PEP-utilizing enzyme [bacterium]|nr:PEP-utilizing enzyme [bacterium]